MNQRMFIDELARYACENNTIAICNKAIQLIDAIVEESGIEHQPYNEGVMFIQEAANSIADSLLGNIGHGWLDADTNKAIQRINQLG